MDQHGLTIHSLETICFRAVDAVDQEQPISCHECRVNFMSRKMGCFHLFSSLFFWKLWKLIQRMPAIDNSLSKEQWDIHPRQDSAEAKGTWQFCLMFALKKWGSSQRSYDVIQNCYKGLRNLLFLWKMRLDRLKSSLNWLVVWNMFYFSIYLENRNPNCRTHIFQRGRNLPPTSQSSGIRQGCPLFPPCLLQ